ncbi:23S rRNA (uracil(1939)-C(5))-methyltransferase RlmD [Anaerovorax odorimutans]|uniref:23S rRNA (Uracil(1939)-C(5))-methyltransferase RlmD n=1 Tax=Anaerovorax odorimutans TaxID=109327 RepID=A0ABT1RPX3_9FIRM|nr:23S rRNA (uracil(1939)-C(5))-methyltransferase RlmD [Anaerovorax odorimutans]MCQ4637230.1 23S rRNA (uracil(1939)-C(5))-methyltransferase RlmD [Anaerovorax odorimutans]
MFEKGQRCQIRIDDMGSEGQGIGRADGLAVFVPGAVAGDLVTVELTKVKKRYAFSKLVSVDEPSPHRIEPLCGAAGCGGCGLALLDYEGQLAIKEKQVRDKLSRLGGLEDPLVRPIVGMDEPFRYRNKAQFPVSTGGIITRKGGVVENLGEPAIGFYKVKSHEVVDCGDCMLQSAAAMAAADALRRFMAEDNITAWDERWEKGLMRHLIVKTAFGTGEVMVVLVINGKGIPNGQKLVEMLDEAIYEAGYSLESVILNINKKKTSQIMGEECIPFAGKPTILEQVGDLSFEISPMSFYQVNPVQMRVLYDQARKYAGLTGKENVLDLYCGVGSIGLYLAREAANVVGIESVKNAVLDANRNAVINGIVNARFVCGRAEEELPQLLEDGGSDEMITDCVQNADVAILDPPRAGCDRRLLEAVAAVGVQRIVYVSCDPATLARDVKVLTELGYEFVEATPVDMFPWTVAVETVCLLSKLKSTNTI